MPGVYGTTLLIYLEMHTVEISIVFVNKKYNVIKYNGFYKINKI